MKKFFTVVILALTTLSINAQDFKTFRFGPTAGLNVAKATNLDDASMVIGFNVGARADYNFNDNCYLGGALLFTQKGYKVKNHILLGGKDMKTNPYYIEIPINAGYRYNFNDKVSVFGEFGPYVAFGIGGKYKAEGYESGKFFGDEGTINATYLLAGGTTVITPKRVDFGLTFAAGVEISKFQVRVGYELGLTNVYSGAGSCKNRNLFAGLSYMF